MRTAAWILGGVAVVSGVTGLVFAFSAVGYHQVDASGIPYALTDVMLATVLLVVAGSALIGLIVLLGVAEMLNQTLSIAGLHQAGDTVDHDV